MLTYRVVERGERSQLEAVLTHRRRIKVLDAKGIEAARVELDVDGYSKVSEIEARSVSPAGQITWMPTTAITSVPRVRGDGPQSPLQRLRFTIPDVKVGGLIEYRYERVYADVDFVPTWVFGATLPVLRSELAVIVPTGVTVDYRQGSGPRLIEAAPLRRELDDGSQRLVFVQQNLPAWYPEPAMPHLARIAPWVVVVVTEYQLDGVRHTMRSWDDVASRLRALAAKVGGEVGDGSPEEIFRTTRDTLRPAGIDGLGVLAPLSANALHRGAPACSRDAAVLLERVLMGTDAKAYPAFVSSPMGPPLVEGLPGLYPFVRAVVAVDVSEQVASDPSCREDPISRGLLCSVPADSFAFLDPSCQGCRYGELPTELTGGRALVLVGEDNRWVRVPEDPPERNRGMSQYKLRLDVDGSLTGAMSADLSGALARRARVALREASEGTARDAALNEQLIGKRKSPRLTEPSYVALDDVDEALAIRAKVEGQLEEVAYERYLLRVVDLVGPSLPGRWRRVRNFPAVLDAPAWAETAVSFVLPPGYDADVRPVTKIVEPYGEYAAGFERRGRTLHFSRRLVLKQQVIAVEQWPGFRKFLDRIEELESAGMSVWLNQGLP